MKAGELRILLFPQAIDPLLECQAVVVVLIVVAADEFARNIDLLENHLHGIQAATEQWPRSPAHHVGSEW